MSELNKQLLEAVHIWDEDKAANECERIFYQNVICLLEDIQQRRTDINMAILQLQEQLKQLNQ